jgi:hypothetical protein
VPWALPIIVRPGGGRSLIVALGLVPIGPKLNELLRSLRSPIPLSPSPARSPTPSRASLPVESCIYHCPARRYGGGRAVSPLVLDIDKDRKRMTALASRKFCVGRDFLFARRAGTADRKRYRLARRRRVGCACGKADSLRGTSGHELRASRVGPKLATRTLRRLQGRPTTAGGLARTCD